MKIQQLLEHHDQWTTPESLSTNLGDGFLFEHNRIYRAIREGALREGFVFKNETNPFYQVLPMTQLETLLAKRSIPFADNVGVLKTLTKFGVHWEDLVGGLKKNHVFHEGCHAVARAEAQRFLQLESETSPTKALRILMEESFANACELLAMIDVEKSTHQIFFEMNSYTFLPEERHHLKTAEQELGLAPFLKFMILAYLQSNFLRNQLDDKNLAQALKLAFGSVQIDPKQMKSLKILARIAFTLDFQFKNETTKLHLRLCGVSLDPKTLDPFEMIFKDPRFQQFLEALVERLDVPA